MNIIWHGFSCFRIQEQGRGYGVTVVTDPFHPEDGKRPPRNLAADIVTVSHDHPLHNNVEAVGGDPFVIDGPGEYEIKDVFVSGVESFHDQVEGKEKGPNTLYYITVGDIHLLHLGDLHHPLEEKHMEDLHHIDILMVPVGGQDVLNAKQAADVVGQIQPRIIIPMHYRAGGVGKKFDTVNPFLKVMGLGDPETVNKLKVAKKDLPQEEMKIIILQPQ